MKASNTDSTELLRLWICRMFRTAGALRHFIGDSGFADLDVALLLKMPARLYEDAKPFDTLAAQKAFTELSRDLEARSKRIRAPRHWRSNLQQLGKLLNLGSVEEAVLLVAAVQDVDPVLRDAFNLFRGHRRNNRVAVIARMLDLPVTEVQKALSGKGRLMSSGLVKWDKRTTGDFLDVVHSEVAEALLSESFSPQSAIRAIASPAPAPSLSLRDYPYLAETLGYMRRYLRSALRDKLNGVNIYLHGPPGTGKSELARVIARDLRATLYEVASEDADGDPISGIRRLGALRLAQGLLARQRALLAFDESEDVFSSSLFSRSVAAERKGWINRMLENNTVPTLWLSNACRGVDPAFLRRFDFIFEVPAPPPDQRIRTLRRICSQELSESVLQRLADCDKLTPAVVARAHAVVARSCKEETASDKGRALLHLVGQTLQSQGHSASELEADKDTIPKVYDLAFLNSDQPLTEISAQLQPDASCRMCLYGPPGTGKSTFGYWLARKLGMPLQVKRASDILSPYLGETEKQISQAFIGAQNAKAILMIDEVDGFLRDRRQAVRSWEVSQVNELLTRMERFQGIFIASTNLMDGMDPASLRRFDLKISFGFLSPQQAQQLLKSHCRNLGLSGVNKAALEAIAAEPKLTPGDFANVARQHRFRRFPDAQAFLQALLNECQLKAGGPRGKLGF
ncbi:MAG: ATP-binding protein [Opitutales bacterium]|nr:ATP-binding protein [Opitutales bacterium]